MTAEALSPLESLDDEMTSSSHTLWLVADKEAKASERREAWDRS